MDKASLGVAYGNPSEYSRYEPWLKFVAREISCHWCPWHKRLWRGRRLSIKADLNFLHTGSRCSTFTTFGGKPWWLASKMYLLAKSFIVMCSCLVVSGIKPDWLFKLFWWKKHFTGNCMNMCSYYVMWTWDLIWNNWNEKGKTFLLQTSLSWFCFCIWCFFLHILWCLHYALLLICPESLYLFGYTVVGMTYFRFRSARFYDIVGERWSLARWCSSCVQL